SPSPSLSTCFPGAKSSPRELLVVPRASMEGKAVPPGAVDPTIQALWAQLEKEGQRVVLEKHRLQEIWMKIVAMHQENSLQRGEFEKEAQFDFVAPDSRIMLNVGGQLFETTAEVLCRDRFSLLASLCKKKSPIQPDETGVFFLDRDWWVFRHILQFLRDGSLPQQEGLLEEMHCEASFYRLNSLRRAIE
ncbi:unnamed protein product, partial [Chrysoparadoxa australica]